MTNHSVDDRRRAAGHELRDRTLTPRQMRIAFEVVSPEDISHYAALYGIDVVTDTRGYAPTCHDCQLA